METIILVMLMGGMNLLAFLIGARVGQKVVNNEPVELPTINPITLYKEHKDKEEMSKEQEKLNTMLDNINNYDGSSANQKEI
jgi:hypothetical protein